MTMVDSFEKIPVKIFWKPCNSWFTLKIECQMSRVAFMTWPIGALDLDPRI